MLPIKPLKYLGREIAVWYMLTKLLVFTLVVVRLNRETVCNKLPLNSHWLMRPIVMMSTATLFSRSYSQLAHRFNTSPYVVERYFYAPM